MVPQLSLFNILINSPPPPDIILHDSRIDCNLEENADNLFVAWNWTTAAGCYVETVRLNYTCNLTVSTLYFNNYSRIRHLVETTW